MTVEQAIQGLEILSGKILPDGYVFTSDESKDDFQCQAMTKWLNETEPNPQIKHLAGGTYYGMATVISKRILEFMRNKYDR